MAQTYLTRSPRTWLLWLVGVLCAVGLFVLFSGPLWQPLKSWFSSGPPRLEAVIFDLNGRPVKVMAGQPLVLRPLDQVKVAGYETSLWGERELSLEGLGFEARPLLTGVRAGDLLPLDQEPASYQLAVNRGRQRLGQVKLVLVVVPVDWVLLSSTSLSPERLSRLKRALDQAPTNPILLDQIFRLAQEMGLDEEAARALEAKTKVSVSVAELAQLARLYQKLGQTQNEVAIVSRLAGLEPTESSWVDRLMGLAEETEDSELKVKTLEKVVEDAGGVRSAEAAKKLGYTYVQAGQWEEAAKAYELAGRLDPDDVHIFKNLAVIYARLKKPDQHRQALMEVARLRPQDTETLKELARMSSDQEAVAAWEKVLELKGDDREAIVALIKLLQPQGPSQRLARLYRAMTKVRPKDPVLHYNLGQTLQDLGQPAQAEAVLAKAHQLAPGDADILTALLEVQRGQKKEAAALATAQKLLALRPRRLDLYDFLYQGLSQAKEYAALEGILSQGVEANPQTAGLWKLLALIRLKMGQTEAGAAALTQAVTLDPADLKSRLSLAQLLEKTGRGREAIPHYQEIVSRDRANLEARLRLAHLLEAAGQKKEALVQYQEILRLNPDHEEAGESLLRLRLEMIQTEEEVKVLEGGKLPP